MSNSIIVAIIEIGRAELERTARAVPEDKLHWKPLDNGRSALDLLGSAAQNPAMAAAMLRGSTDYGPDLFARLAEERKDWTREVALETLNRNVAELVAEIEKFSDQQLQEPITMPMGGATRHPRGTWILFAYRSLMARTAQINYIQTLYGDFDRH